MKARVSIVFSLYLFVLLLASSSEAAKVEINYVGDTAKLEVISALCGTTEVCSRYERAQATLDQAGDAAYETVSPVTRTKYFDDYRNGKSHDTTYFRELFEKNLSKLDPELAQLVKGNRQLNAVVEDYLQAQHAWLSRQPLEVQASILKQRVIRKPSRFLPLFIGTGILVQGAPSVAQAAQQSIVIEGAKPQFITPMPQQPRFPLARPGVPNGSWRAGENALGDISKRTAVRYAAKAEGQAVRQEVKALGGGMAPVLGTAVIAYDVIRISKTADSEMAQEFWVHRAALERQCQSGNDFLARSACMTLNSIHTSNSYEREKIEKMLSIWVREQSLLAFALAALVGPIVPRVCLGIIGGLWMLLSMGGRHILKILTALKTFVIKFIPLRSQKAQNIDA